MNVLLAAVLLAGVPLTGQNRKKGSLENFEKPFRVQDPEKKRSPDPPKSEASRRFRVEDDDDDDDDFCSEILGEIVFYPIFKGFEFLFTYPFYDNQLRFDAYPYAGEEDFFMELPDSGKWLAFEAHAYFLRVEHDLQAYGLAGTARFVSGVDLHFDVSQYRERFDGRTDRLTFQQYHVNYDRLPSMGKEIFWYPYSEKLHNTLRWAMRKLWSGPTQ